MVAHKPEQPVVLTVDELRQLSKDTVMETLGALGVDTKNPLEVQRDFQFIRDWRKAVDAVRGKAVLTAVVVLVTGIIAVFWIGFKTFLK
jgi:uncharacterized membrane protein